MRTQAQRFLNVSQLISCPPGVQCQVCLTAEPKQFLLVFLNNFMKLELTYCTISPFKAYSSTVFVYYFFFVLSLMTYVL